MTQTKLCSWEDTVRNFFTFQVKNTSEFNVNVMTGNNEAYQHSPYGLVIQKFFVFFVQAPEFFFTSMELMISLANDNVIEVKKNSGVWRKKKGHLQH